MTEPSPPTESNGDGTNGATGALEPAGAQMPQFVTTLKSIEHQVGENVIRALQSPSTAAVLSTVVLDPSGQQHIVSMPLNPGMMGEIQALLQAGFEEARPPDEVQCVGFHCRVRREEIAKAKKQEES